MTLKLTSRQEWVLSLVPEGEENAIHTYELQAITNLGSRELRKIVETLRRSGCVICSTNAGYFKPASIDELRRHIARQDKLSRSVQFTLQTARQLEREWRLRDEFAPNSRLDEGVNDYGDL